MNIQQLIQLSTNRYNYYQNLFNIAQNEGDIDKVNKYQELLDITQDTIDKLGTLL
jgi:flagellar biosynthesis chaperone FliJ